MAKQNSVYTRQLSREIEATPVEYIPALLEIVRIFRETVALKSAPESFKQGWKEARSGQTKPVSKLWKEVDA